MWQTSSLAGKIWLYAYSKTTCIHSITIHSGSWLKGCNIWGYQQLFDSVLPNNVIYVFSCLVILHKSDVRECHFLNILSWSYVNNSSWKFKFSSLFTEWNCQGILILSFSPRRFIKIICVFISPNMRHMKHRQITKMGEHRQMTNMSNYRV